MELIFWHNIISPHQAPFMRELAERGNAVTIVSTEAMSPERHTLGWAVPKVGPSRVVLGPSSQDVLEIVKSSSATSIHFIAGARGTLLGRHVGLACRSFKRRTGIITEAPDMRGFSGRLRWLKYALERVTLGRSFDFILAMGQVGTSWFVSCGYSPRRVFPFSYVTEKYSGSVANEEGDRFRILFVGRLVNLKGVDLLLEALKNVPNALLTLIGEGPEEEELKKFAVSCGVEDRVDWLGQMAATELHFFMANADLVVLPSRKDGWGAVVNEALMAGTPVVCSTASGSSDLIRHPWVGSIFQSGSVNDLTAALVSWVDKGRRNAKDRQRLQMWAQCIEASAIADYLELLMEHIYQEGPKPIAPWRENSQ